MVLQLMSQKVQCSMTIFDFCVFESGDEEDVCQ